MKIGPALLICWFSVPALLTAADPPVLMEFPIGDVEIRHVEGPHGMVLTVEHRQVGVQGRQFYLGDGRHAVLFAASQQGLRTPGGLHRAAAISLPDGTQLTVAPSAIEPWGQTAGHIYLRIPNLRFRVEAVDGIVQRAAADPQTLSSGKLSPRVDRDDTGAVLRLKLGGMKLSAADFEEIVGLPQLQSLVLRDTNVTDQDLVILAGCPRLRALNVSDTDVSDVGIDAILQMKKLTSLCLGQVCVTEQGIERLRAANRERDDRDEPRLRWGYSMREEPTR